MDVAVVGAGAAGLAAARRLLEQRSELPAIVLEAAPHSGGRAHTVDPPEVGGPLDLGCGWFHGAESNPWLSIAESVGFHIDRTPPPWDVQYRDFGFPLEDRRAYERASAAFYARLSRRLNRRGGALMMDEDAESLLSVSGRSSVGVLAKLTQRRPAASCRSRWPRRHEPRTEADRQPGRRTSPPAFADRTITSPGVSLRSDRTPNH